MYLSFEFLYSLNIALELSVLFTHKRLGYQKYDVWNIEEKKKRKIKLSLNVFNIFNLFSSILSSFGKAQMSHNLRSTLKLMQPVFISHNVMDREASYLVPRYNPIRHILWPKCRWPWPLVKVKGQGQIFPKMGKIPKNWSYLGCYFTYRLYTWYQGTTQ